MNRESSSATLRRAHHVVIAYDISDDYRREQVAKVLLRLGDRVQKSVFECDATERRIRAALDRIVPLLDRRSDSVRCCYLCGACISRVVVVPDASSTPIIAV